MSDIFCLEIILNVVSGEGRGRCEVGEEVGVDRDKVGRMGSVNFGCEIRFDVMVERFMFVRDNIVDRGW